jgi:hypothetical protein
MVIDKMTEGVPCYHLQHVNVIGDFTRNVWKDRISEYNLNVIVNSVCTNPSAGIGNVLGTYFNTVACAHRSHVNLVTIKRYGHENHNHTVFFDALIEDIITPASSQHPVIPISGLDVYNNTNGMDRARAICVCETNCWSNLESPWLSDISYISSRMRLALDKYDREVVDHDMGTVLGHAKDRATNNSIGSYLPIVPDVAIQ